MSESATFPLSLPRTMFRRLLFLLFLSISTKNAAAVPNATTSLNITSPDTRTQYTLGDFEIKLTPTPLALTNVDMVLGKAIEDVVDARLRGIYAESFQYMYVAGVKQIDFREPEGGGTRGRFLLSRTSKQVVTPASDRNLMEATTSVVFNGGVIAFDEDPAVNVRGIVQSSIEDNLVKRLVGNGGAWSLIQQAVFTDLEPLPTPGPTSSPTETLTMPPTSAPVVAPTPAPVVAPTRAPTASPTASPTDAPTAAPSNAPTSSAPTETPVAPPTGISAGIQQVESETRSSDDDESRIQRILGGFFGFVICMLAALMLARLSHRRSQQQEQQLDELASAISHAEEEHSSISSTNPDFKSSSPHELDLGKYPVTPQSPVSSGGDIMDSVSVTSEWTLASSCVNAMNEDSSSLTRLGNVSPKSATATTSKRNVGSSNTTRVAAMGFASNETFERDRRVTLTKDLLQSEWVTATRRSAFPSTRESNSLPMVMTSSDAAAMLRTASPTRRNHRRRTPEFQAQEEGEEVYLMPPPPSSVNPRQRSRSRGRHSRSSRGIV